MTDPAASRGVPGDRPGMSDPQGGRELSRFLVTVRGPRRMSQEAVEATARDFADAVTGTREDRELLARILIQGAED